MNLLKTAVDALKPKLMEAIGNIASPKLEDLEKLKESGVISEEELNEIIKTKEEQIKTAVDGAIRKLNELGSAYSLLAIGTVSLVTRIAGSVAGIISITPVGPGISPNLLLPLLQQLKGEGDNLSKVFDEVNTKLEETKPFLDYLKNPETGEENPAVSAIITTITGTLATTKIACLAVGSPCDGEDAEMPNPDTPQAEEYKASDCENYEADDEHTGTNPETQEPWPEERKYCKKFEALITKSIDDFQDTPEKTAQEQYDEWLAGTTCNDCKFFKKK